MSRLVRADKRYNNSPAWIHEPFLLCVNTPGWWTWWNCLGNAFVAYFRLFTAYLTIVAKHLPSFLPFWPQFTLIYFQHVTIVKVLSNWLHEHENSFRVLQWSSQSPDLYLIEHLYDVMEWEVPKTLQAVKSTWTVCVVLIINCSVSVYLEYFTVSCIGSCFSIQGCLCLRGYEYWRVISKFILSLYFYPSKYLGLFNFISCLSFNPSLILLISLCSVLVQDLNLPQSMSPPKLGYADCPVRMQVVC